MFSETYGAWTNVDNIKSSDSTFASQLSPDGVQLDGGSGGTNYLKATVITSYSIHYTKLYEQQRCLKSSPQLKA